MSFSYWFVARQKRQLTPVLQALFAFSDVCVGKVWDKELQLEFEDVLGNRGITEHGDLRARRTGQGGGGTRCLFKQMRDLGLVFLEQSNSKCRLTLIGEEIVSGRISFVEAMRLQLKRYQYPSACSWSGRGAIDHSFHVHPFQFILRLLRDPRLQNYLTNEELYGIVIHKALSDSATLFEDVVERILCYRREDYPDFIADTRTKTYNDIANTLCNYISVTQYIDRGYKTISIRSGKEADVDSFIESSPTFIQHPDKPDIYLRRYGRGSSTRDSRQFDRETSLSQRDRNESRIKKEYILLAIKTPITAITPGIVEAISHNTGIDERTVERFLIQNYHPSIIDDFFFSYRELAHMSRSGATEFEKATCEIFKKIFHMRADHVGPRGNTPDVFVESLDSGFCGIIDTKAYSNRNGYSISGDHKRVMEDVYIPTYKRYGQTELPLAFFSYIAGSFGTRINSQLSEIILDTGIRGSAMPVDIFINFAQDYLEKGYTHSQLCDLFRVNREVQLSDISNLECLSDEYEGDLLEHRQAAESQTPYGSIE